MKTCSKCGFVGDNDLFRKRGNRCLECRRKQRKEYREISKPKLAEKRKEYYESTERKYRQENKKNNSPQRKEHYKKNRERINTRNKEYNKRGREELTNWYVIMKTCRQLGLKAVEIPPEMLELKREQLQLHRLIKEAQNGITRTGNQGTSGN